MTLLTNGGREAVTTRAVEAAADVQAPTIYRHFGDMDGLLDAVAREGFAAYVRDKAARARAADPVDDLRAGWDLHVSFGLANPGVYTLMYGNPRPGTAGPGAAAEAEAILRSLVQCAAEAGRLRVSVEHAATMIGAAGVGVTLALIARGASARDTTLSAATREAVLAAVTTAVSGPAQAGGDDRRRAAERAIALKAVLPAAPGNFTDIERALLGEWLDRVATGHRADELSDVQRPIRSAAAEGRTSRVTKAGARRRPRSAGSPE